MANEKTVISGANSDATRSNTMISVQVRGSGVTGALAEQLPPCPGSNTRTRVSRVRAA